VRLSYYPETDSLYIDLSAKESSESREVSPGIVLDYDDENNLVGIDIDNASRKLDLKELTLSKLPTEKQTLLLDFLNMRSMRPGTYKNPFKLT
jgi:uncharacterized protein YuzE